MAKTPNTTTAPTGQIAPFGLRMLPEMRGMIESAAKSSGRSMNAEIIARLQISFDSDRMELEPGSVSDKLMAVKQELEKAQKNLDDSATNIADKMLDRMHERGLVFKKGIVDGASITSTILVESPNTHEGS